MRRVYFIRPVGQLGPVKIGCSHNPEKRAKSLSTKARPVEVVAALPGGFDLEVRFHSRFLSNHVGKEWFNWSPEIEATIEAISAGTFDVATLPERGERLPRKPVEITPLRREAMRVSAKVRQQARVSGWSFNENGVQPKWCSGDEAFRQRVAEYLSDPRKHSHRWLYSDTWQRWYREANDLARPVAAEAA